VYHARTFGNDPNWGRSLCAIGNTDAYFKEDKIDVSIQNNPIVKNGVEVRNFNAKKISSLLKSDKVTISVNLKLGKEKATAYGCDMSYDYVSINANYHT